ncbi:MAG: uroporphyrinogen decarboxylase family protein [Planctomycetota bacterium]|jgi:uroporphyrinogen decarboxylase
MNSIECVYNVLERKGVDYLPLGVWPWQSTVERWVSEGHIREDEDVYEHFGQDIRCHVGDLNSVANVDFEDVVIEETEDDIVTLDGNGAKLRRKKKSVTTPERIDFTVKDCSGWQEHIKHYLSFEQYRKERVFCRKNQRFFCWHGMGPFEQMHPVCGHENLLMGMALDGQWVKDMVKTYVDFTINHLEELFSEEGLPDGVWFSEDMGFKGKPFMSPEMYKEIMFPGHKRLFDFIHSKGLKVIVHSCGYIVPLVEGLIEAGMDCLQGMEVKAGMDLVWLFREFGDRISFFGGIDERVLISNNKKMIDKELYSKIPAVIKGEGGYILHSDHSEPPEVDYETVWYFIKKGRQIADEYLTG